MRTNQEAVFIPSLPTPPPSNQNPCTVTSSDHDPSGESRGDEAKKKEDDDHGVYCTYLVGDHGLVEGALPAPVPDDEQAERPVVLGRVLQPFQLRGGRRAPERGHGQEREHRGHGPRRHGWMAGLGRKRGSGVMDGTARK